MEVKGVSEVQCYSSFNLRARWGGWLKPRPGHFPLGNDPVSIVQGADWAPRPVWTGAENLAFTAIRYCRC